MVAERVPVQHTHTPNTTRAAKASVYVGCRRKCAPASADSYTCADGDIRIYCTREVSSEVGGDRLWFSQYGLLHLYTLTSTLYCYEIRAELVISSKLLSSRAARLYSGHSRAAACARRRLFLTLERSSSGSSLLLYGFVFSIRLEIECVETPRTFKIRVQNSQNGRSSTFTILTREPICTGI